MSTRLTIWIVFMFVVLLICSGRAAAGADETGTNEEVSRRRQAVADAEERLAQLQSLADSGAVPASRAQQAAIELAEARIRLAALEGQQKELLDALKSLVEHREERWTQLQQALESGAVPEANVTEARIELAEARIRLELHTIVALRREYLAEVQQLAGEGIVPQHKVEQARGAFDDAQARLIQAQPNVDAAALPRPPLLTDRAKELMQERFAILATINDQVMHAYRAGESGVDQVHEAKRALLSAKLELIQDHAERVRVLEELVKEADDWAKVVSEAAKAREATTIDVLKARAQLLEARIALEQAQQLNRVRVMHDH